MVDKLKIDSKYYLGQTSLQSFSDEEIKNEPMLFSCDWMFAYNNAGLITRHWLDTILADNNSLPNIIDTRVHMLMPGWFPCIPGFHHDDVPRSGANGQPNYHNPEYRSKHVLSLINGDIAPTELAVGEFEVDDIIDGSIIYKTWHLQVEEQLNNGIGDRVQVPSNKLVYFDDRTFHQGTRAVSNGWRWFARGSWNTDREVKNEIRSQVQVYLEHPMEGW